MAPAQLQQKQAQIKNTIDINTKLNNSFPENTIQQYRVIIVYRKDYQENKLLLTITS